MTEEIYFDVIVVGAGNAALCAALSAREAGASVVVLEKAPASAQGGNCPFTGGGFRFTHEGLADLRENLLPPDADVGRASMDPYTADDFRRHFGEATHGDTSAELAEVVIAQSRPTVDWMHSRGVVWELYINPNLENAPSVIPNQVGLAAHGSGPGLVEMLTRSAVRAGVQVLFETKMVELTLGERGEVTGLIVQDGDGRHAIRAKAVVLACGGFEANPEMRVKYLGGHWEKARVRGSRYNTGDGHRAALDAGAAPAGQWTGCHGTPIDVDAPVTGELPITDAMPRRSYPLGIMVNVGGLRFIDEGASFAEQTFVRVGEAVLEQERSIAYQLFDARSAPLLEPRYGGSTPAQSDTIEGLAEAIDVNAGVLRATIDAYNAEAHEGDYAPRLLDGRSTKTLTPPKTNWAIRIDRPPFFAYRVTGGITYTYGGLRIDADARVLDMEDRPIAGLYAAGEIVGGIFYHGSLRAAGLMHGSVFGRLGGAHAAGLGQAQVNG